MWNRLRLPIKAVVITKILYRSFRCEVQEIDFGRHVVKCTLSKPQDLLSSSSANPQDPWAPASTSFGCQNITMIWTWELSAAANC